jgi:hypothetical protein
MQGSKPLALRLSGFVSVVCVVSQVPDYMIVGSSIRGDLLFSGQGPMFVGRLAILGIEVIVSRVFSGFGTAWIWGLPMHRAM